MLISAAALLIAAAAACVIFLRPFGDRAAAAPSRSLPVAPAADAPANSPAAARKADSPYLYVSALDGLVLRSGASASTDKLCLLPYGSRLKLIEEGPKQTIGEERDSWFRVSFETLEGWVFGAFADTREPPMAKVYGEALPIGYGYDMLGAYNIDTRWMYSIENTFNELVGGGEVDQIYTYDDETAEERAARIERDRKLAQAAAAHRSLQAYFEIGGLPPGSYAVYTWNRERPAAAEVWLDPDHYDPNPRGAQLVVPKIVTLGPGGAIPGDGGAEFPCHYNYSTDIPSWVEPLDADTIAAMGSSATCKAALSDTMLFSDCYDFLEYRASKGRSSRDARIDEVLRIDRERSPTTIRYKTFIPVVDSEGNSWWADSYGLKFSRDGESYDWIGPKPISRSF